MKFRKILSTALLVTMLFTAISVALPFTASAAYSESSAASGTLVPEGYKEANLNSEELETYLAEYTSYDFDTAAEMLNYELQCGYLYYKKSPGNTHTIFINKYTGFVYYVNNVTGQIITSNPIDPVSADQQEDRELLMSQIAISFYESANSTNSYEYNSQKWAASRSQISVSTISGGLRVNYTLGDTTVRFLLPGQAVAERFEETILVPIINSFEALMEEYCYDDSDEDLNFFDNENYTDYEYGCINTSSSTGLRAYLKAMISIARDILGGSSAEYKQLYALQSDINTLVGAYTLNVPEKYIGNDRYKKELEKMYETYPITKDGTAIYAYSASPLSEAKRSYANIIKLRCPDYTFAEMYSQESECGYVDNSAQKPVFRCSLEYTFNDDGSLSVRLPASSIVFDETVYTLRQITPLQYFGAGDMTNDGYIFYPDGSGTIIEFDDFYSSAAKIPINLESEIYGKDYAYSKLSGLSGAYNAQITMPVYGLVNEVEANEAIKQIYGVETVTNGFFAIIEKGSALSYLKADMGGETHKYASVCAYFNPYPSDEYDLSETLSVGSLGIYTIVSESHFTGSYVMRYVMLTDDKIADAREELYGEASYDSDYIGMATYYRDYLKADGVLKALDTVYEDIPLYIEALGAMDITSKFLSFPVTETISLTKFSDISTIYSQLSNCEDYVIEQIAYYSQLASVEDDAVLKYQYERQAERYSELAGKIQNITNINFKLTGFANGGMKSTYPAKLKWVKACGGKSGFNSLISNAATISADGKSNFSVYPEFDFMYIYKTEMFDGIIVDDITSLMVDNRYASKQIYNSVLQEYESFYTMVVSPDSFEGLYSKFQKKYSKYDVENISVSTLGSDLNSNFDEENSINRDEAMQLVESLLGNMSEDYDLMIDTGNIYAVKYATHILNANIDSSHHRYTSYSVPFSAIILHGYVNYASTPINYSGSPDYEMLRAIESGAALYYIVCFDNTSHLKDDDTLSEYYGVSYQNWFDDIVSSYKQLNDIIGDLQDYEIVDHDILIAEREIEDAEMAVNYVYLQNEILELLDEQLLAAVDSALAELKGDPANYDKRIKLVVNADNLIENFAEILNLSVEELSEGENSFAARVKALVKEYTDYYNGASLAENTVEYTFSTFEYNSKYSYITDSCAQDEDYVYTEYTVDKGNVTMVTYQKGDSVVKYILNYNNFSVTVRLSETEVYELGAYSCSPRITE